MVADLGPAGWAASVGAVPTAAFTITKLAWIAHHEPKLIAQTRHMLLPHDWLTWKLTGDPVTDRSEASGTRYYAAHEGRYLPEHLQRWVHPDLDWDSIVPRVLAPDEPAGQGPVRNPVGPGQGCAVRV
jgi:xylulokinase